MPELPAALQHIWAPDSRHTVNHQERRHPWEFDREKLHRGIRLACVKRPVSAREIDELVQNVETSLQKIGRAEISSRVVGDLAIAGLKELDLVAYVRFAIVYLRLDDLNAIRKEIDRLLDA